MKAFQSQNPKDFKNSIFWTDLESLRRFEISLASICDLYPDLKSVCPDLKYLSQFVMLLPRFEICLNLPQFVTPLLFRFATQNIFPQFFVSYQFGTGIWTWITFDFETQIWWNLVWEPFGMIPKNDFGFSRNNPGLWLHHHLALFWFWNSDMNKSCLSRFILMKPCHQTFWHDS